MSLLDFSLFPSLSLLSKSQNTVLLVQHPFSHEKFIIKKINRREFPHHMVDLQEVFLLNALKNEHLIQIVGFNCRQYKRNNEQFYELSLLMPYVGQDLSKIVEEKKKEKKFFMFEEIKRISIQLAETMEFLHEKGVAHRDLKPDNVLWNGEKIVLCDLSDSFMKNKVKNQAKTIVGSPYYMSPELKHAFVNCQELSKENYDPYKSDIYSLGLSLIDISILSIGEKTPLAEKLSEIESRYGKDFRSCIEACFEQDWKIRISAKELKERFCKIKDPYESICLSIRVRMDMHYLKEKELKHDVAKYRREFNEMCQKIENKLSQKTRLRLCRINDLLKKIEINQPRKLEKVKIEGKKKFKGLIFFFSNLLCNTHPISNC